MPTVADIAADLEQFAPRPLAADWDNVGLLLGDPASAVARIMTCLTVTPAVVAEAVTEQCSLIVSHHPILFRGTKRITAATSEGRMLLDLVRSGVAVYSPHTAFDNTVGGINDQIAAILGLMDVRPLRPAAGAATCKIVVFVPQGDLGAVSEAVFAAGAGRIGQYRECSFRVGGTGTFFGEYGANPVVGIKGRREEVEELRFEVMCPAENIDGVIAAIRRAHSYEEPAFDIYPLRSPAIGGEGRIGSVSTTLEHLARTLRSALRSGPVQLIGKPERAVTKVAIACGAGGEFLADAIRAGADALVTGEMRFHDFLAAESAGIGVALPGHYASEHFAVEALAVRLGTRWPECKVVPSSNERDPATWII